MDNLEREHVKHKAKWKNLHLEPTVCLEYVLGDGGGVRPLRKNTEIQEDQTEGMAMSEDLQNINIEQPVQTVQCVQTVHIEMLHTLGGGDD